MQTVALIKAVSFPQGADLGIHMKNNRPLHIKPFLMPVAVHPHGTLPGLSQLNECSGKKLITVGLYFFQ